MKSCLIVDDSNIIRKVARRFVEDMHYVVSEAESAQEALDRCKVELPDVIILDWHMPAMSAMEFLSALRVTISGRRPYIIYCTTENDSGEISRAISAGADTYMMKPFDRQMIITKFAEIPKAA